MLKLSMRVKGDFEPTSPIEEVTTALHDKTVKFMLTHDVNIRMPEVMFDGAIFRIEPRSIEGNGMLAKLEFVPRTAVQARADATPRILFKKIKKFFQGKLLLAFLAVILIIKIIKIKVMWLLPLLVGVGTAKKLVLKFLLFLFPALSHIFKLCTYYHQSYHKPNFHHHHHQIKHLHTFFPHEHGSHNLPELIYTKPPTGHPAEYIHGAPVPPHAHFQPELHYETSGPGLGSEFISDRNSYVDNSFKPRYEDLNEINAWGLGSTPAPSQLQQQSSSSPQSGTGHGHSSNVNPLTHQHQPRIVVPKPVYGPPPSSAYGPPGYSAKRNPTGAASSIAATYASAPTAEEQLSQEVGADVEVRAGVRPRRLHRIQQIFSNFYLESESVKSGIFGELKSELTSYPTSRVGVVFKGSIRNIGPSNRIEVTRPEVEGLLVRARVKWPVRGTVAIAIRTVRVRGSWRHRAVICGFVLQFFIAVLRGGAGWKKQLERSWSAGSCSTADGSCAADGSCVFESDRVCVLDVAHLPEVPGGPSSVPEEVLGLHVVHEVCVCLW
ncbi:conserved hypothetical protein [Culex quinquefasciatus]|uniref:Uncharacterized protein n=1 Tax=Culex quinquefasciatus TaxID=7176 RepID=B0WS71_CULQU|nr:conserved hypothetical protein [Culex quinquefasciatus]|eukprot:XP_001851555.1 conserved hypothetical protein [Culex quinquefasciatus]